MQPRRFYGHCCHCGKQGHLKRDCPGFRAEWNKGKRKYEVHKAANEDNDSSDCDALIMGTKLFKLALEVVGSWTTCHMCNESSMFGEYQSFRSGAEKVTLGGWLNAIGRGTVVLMMNLPKGKRRCKLYDVLFVPGLSYNLLSISKGGKWPSLSNLGVKLPILRTSLLRVHRSVEVFISWNASLGIRQTPPDVWHRRYGDRVLSSWQLTVW